MVKKKKYDYKILGISARLDTLQAIILIEKLKLLDNEIKKREKIYNFYFNELNKIKKLKLSKIQKGNESNYSVFSILVKEKRKKFINYLNKYKIPTTIYYPKPLDRYKIFNKSQKKTSNAYKISKQILSLPMSAYLSTKKQKYIVNKIKKYFL